MICEAQLRYRADITVGSLKVAESRVIADLLLKGRSMKDEINACLLGRFKSAMALS